MIQIKDTIVSLDIINENFCCDLTLCKGFCCVDGDAGAPLEYEEIKIIEDILPEIWNDFSEKQKEVITNHGVSYIDYDKEPVTSLVDNKDCVFVYKDKDGCSKCLIEKAFREGKTNYPKPVSCHLYPVRLRKYEEFTAVNYHRWEICQCARDLGNKLKIPVYQFLKDPLIKYFGQDWYKELEIAANEINKI